MISISFDIVPFVFLVCVVVTILSIITINMLLMKKVNNLVRYNEEYGITLLSNKNQFLFLFFGVFLVLFLKNTIRDAIKYIYMINSSNNLQQKILMFELDNDITRLLEKEKVYERNAKIIKIKYNNKNFVNQKFFNIFVLNHFINTKRI